MDREQKATAIAEIGVDLAGADAIFAVDYRGLSVTQAALLRNQLREAGTTLSIVKNRLAKIALAEQGTVGLDEHLVGPTALAYVTPDGDPVIAAKAIAEFRKKHEVLVFKGGLMDGTSLDRDQFEAIAKLPGVEVLHGQLVGLIASPLTGLVRTLNQLIAGLAIALGQVSEQGLLGTELAGTEPDATEPDAAEPEAAEPTEASEEESPPAEDAAVALGEEVPETAQSEEDQQNGNDD